MNYPESPLSQFNVWGISYQTAAVHQRELYSLNDAEQAELLRLLQVQTGFKGFVVSTCNRTELIGFVANADLALELFISQTRGNIEEFKTISYHFTGHSAFSHLLRVGVGMESQIPGDFEIIMQVKKGFKLARKIGAADGYLEKIVNHVIHASKRVKTETAFSTGATSVSYAAVKYLKDHYAQIENANILVYGMGKFGRITLDHLVGIVPEGKISIVNRTDAKSQAIAGDFGVQFVPHDELKNAILEANVVIVATGAKKPILFAADFAGARTSVVIDLSVPANVDDSVGELEGMTMLDVDAISSLTSEALNQRRKELPRVICLIEQERVEFEEWLGMQPHMPAVDSAIDNIKENITFSEQKSLAEQLFPGADFAQATPEFLERKLRSYLCHHLRLGTTVDDAVSSMVVFAEEL